MYFKENQHITTNTIMLKKQQRDLDRRHVVFFSPTQILYTGRYFNSRSSIGERQVRVSVSQIFVMQPNIVCCGFWIFNLQWWDWGVQYKNKNHSWEGDMPKCHPEKSYCQQEYFAVWHIGMLPSHECNMFLLYLLSHIRKC